MRQELERISLSFQVNWGLIQKSLPTMRETWVQSLGWEDLLKKEMATHSSTLAWKIPWTEELGTLQSMGSQRVGHDWATFTYLIQKKLLVEIERSWNNGNLVSIAEVVMEVLTQTSFQKRNYLFNESLLADNLQLLMPSEFTSSFKGWIHVLLCPASTTNN